jgi:hypothetical protein
MALIGRDRDTKSSNNPVRLNGRGVANFLPAVPYNGWVTSFGGVLGKYTSSVADGRNAYLALYLTDQNRTPSALQGWGLITGINKDIGGDTGRRYTVGVQYSVHGGLKLPLFAGLFPAIAAFAAHDVGVGVKTDGTTVYKKNTTPPPATFGVSEADQSGSLDLFLNYQYNSAPVAGRTAPIHGAVSIDTTPLLSGTFTDFDTAVGDALTAFHIQVRHKLSGVMMWDSVTAQAGGAAWSREYAGTALSVDTYQWRARVADYFTTWSEWLGWTDFIIAEGPRVEEPLTVSGKQETLTPGPFTANYFHSLGAGYNQLKIEIWNASNGAPTTLRNTATITASGAASTLISIPWQVGWSVLEWSKDYLVRIQARDTSNFYSPWSPYHPFNVNYASTTPGNLTPNTLAPRSFRPTLSAIASDVDDTVASGLIVDFRIKGPATLSNNQFTSNITGWSTVRFTTGMSSVNSWDAVEGVPVAGSLKMVVTAAVAAIGARYQLALSDNIPIIPGETYRASHSRKTSNPAIMLAKFCILWYQADGVTPSVLSPVSVEIFGVSYVQPTNTWETKGYVMTAPADASFARIGLAAETVVASGSATVYGDNYGWDVSNSRFIRAATLRVGSDNIWDYVVTATDAPQFGIHKFDARSKDGSYVSPWSIEAQFNYQPGPTIAITTPTAAQVVATPSVSVAWTTTLDQVSYRTYVYFANTDLLAYDSGLVNSAALIHVIPVGYLHHNNSYEVVIESTTSLGLSGESARRAFSVFFPLPATITNFMASPIPVAGDTEPSAILLTWDVADTPPNTFVEYTITRTAIAGTIGVDTSTIILRRISSVGQNTFTDLFPASEVSYLYTIRQVYMVAADPVESLAAESQATISLKHALVSSAAFGTDLRASLRYVDDSEIEHVGDREFVLPWGETEPTVYIGPARYDIIDASFKVVNDRYSSAKENMDNMRAIDSARVPVCYRDNRGRKVFGYVDFTEEDTPMGMFVIHLVITQTNFREGQL